MPIEIRSIDSMDVKIDDAEHMKQSLWCFGDCLTEKEKDAIKDQKAKYLIPTNNMGMLSCKGFGGVHNVSFLGSEEEASSEDQLVWQFEIFTDMEADIALKSGDLIELEVDGEKI